MNEQSGNPEDMTLSARDIKINGSSAEFFADLEFYIPDETKRREVVEGMVRSLIDQGRLDGVVVQVTPRNPDLASDLSDDAIREAFGLNGPDNNQGEGGK